MAGHEPGCRSGASPPSPDSCKMRHMHRALTRIGRLLWLRGFGPATFVFILAIASCFEGMNWQGDRPSASPPGSSTRVQVVMGRVLWERGRPPPGFTGRWPTMTLGELMYADFSRLKPGFVFWAHQPFKYDQYWRSYLDVFFYSWHAQFNLAYVGLLLTIPPIAFALRRKRRPDWACQECGYDLRGTAVELPCPECGTSRRR